MGDSAVKPFLIFVVYITMQGFTLKRKYSVETAKYVSLEVDEIVRIG